MKKLLALLIAGLGIGLMATPAADARQPVTPLTTGVGSVYINETVVIRTGGYRRHNRRHVVRHRGYRTVRKVYYRNGRRVVVVRRIRY